MLNSKERALLSGAASTMNPMFNVGKEGVTPELVAAVTEALEVHELIKLQVLKNSEEDIKEAAQTIAGRTRSELVKVIGRKFILFKMAKDPDKRRYLMK